MADDDAGQSGRYSIKFRRRSELERRTEDIEKAIEELETGVRDDASALIDFSSAVSDGEILALGQEVSLGSTARDLWRKLGEKVESRDEDGAVNKATRECAEAMAELGKAAQARFGGKEARAEDLASAGARARRAVEDLTKSYAEEAEEAGNQLDKAWKNDALRAILTLEQAPEALQREIRRQRLLNLQPELRVLGLDQMPSDLITEKMLKERRIARAKELHPDVALAGEAVRVQQRAPTAASREGRGFFGALGGLIGSFFRGAEDDAAYRTDITMVEINRAYEKLRKVVAAPVNA